MSRLWYDARDTFLGLNYKKRDMEKGLEMAKICQEDDAIWLCSVFPDEPPPDRQSAYRVILASEDTPRAKCFAALLVGNRLLLHRAAVLGNHFALAECAMVSMGIDFPTTERNVFAWYGHNVKYECAEKAAVHYQVAASLGHVTSQYCLALLYPLDSQERYYWLAEAVEGGRPEATMDFNYFMRSIDSKRGMFFIGEQLTMRTQMFKGVPPASRLRLYYDSVRKSAAHAIETWLMIAKRLGVVRDIRRVIAKVE